MIKLGHKVILSSITLLVFVVVVAAMSLDSFTKMKNSGEALLERIEQSQGTNQIVKALSQIDKVT